MSGAPNHQRQLFSCSNISTAAAVIESYTQQICIANAYISMVMSGSIEFLGVHTVVVECRQGRKEMYDDRK